MEYRKTLKSPIKSPTGAHKLLNSSFYSRRNTDGPNATITIRRKMPADIDLIEESLKKHFIFRALKQKQKQSVITYFIHFALAGGDTIFEQNSTGKYFFIVAFGKVEILVNDQRICVLSPGDSFGELALLHDIPRSATVRTLESTCLWGLDRETFRKVVYLSNSKWYRENRQFLDSIPMFQKLNGESKDKLLNNLATLEFMPDDTIVREGDVGGLFYIIKEGEVNCTVKGRLVRTMEKGEFFGEQALLGQGTRTASVIAVTMVRCLVTCKENLAQVFKKDISGLVYRNSIRISLEKSRYLKVLAREQIEKVIDAMHIVPYEQGSVVVPQKTCRGADLWVVLNGELESNNCKISDMQCIGDKELTDSPQGTYKNAIIAAENSTIAYISRDDFEETLGYSLTDARYNNEALQALKKSQLFRMLHKDKLIELISVCKIVKYNQGTEIITENQPGSTFFIIKAGSVDVVKEGVSIRRACKLDYFGERSLLFNGPRTATVVALSNVECWTLSQTDFFELIDENIRKQLVMRIEMQDNAIQISDLVTIEQLGCSNNAELSLVSYPPKHLYFLLKVFDTSVMDQTSLKHLENERQILLEVDHNMIQKMIKTVLEQERLFFLMEHVPGLDMSTVLRQHNFFKEEEVIFYAGCLISIIEYLHDRNIAHRDIKPENIVVDSDGYLKLTEFVSAKEINGRSFTMVGTPHYMSPEVVLGRGHGLCTDYWSLGVVIYEMITGNTPFGANLKEPVKIYDAIVKRKLIFPKFFSTSKSAMTIIDKLLNKNPINRIRGSFENLKADPWFMNLKWSELEMRKLRSPFRPKIKDIYVNRFEAKVTPQIIFTQREWDKKF